MSIQDKINIYVPAMVGAMLERDMEMFEIYKANGRSLNWNRFLSMLIKGYYDTYVQENKALYEKIMSALTSTALDEKQAKEAADRIMNNVIRPDGNKRGGKDSRHLSLKPTSSTEDLVQRIAFSGEDYISRYFRGLLMSYCEKPFSQRERIVFKDNYELLRQYCHAQQPVYLSTIWEERIVHEVVPYAIAIGPEEMFNFLLCQEENPVTHDMEAKAFGLRRIKHVNASDKRTRIQPAVHQHLHAMVKMGPQYAINDDEEICVRLTERGMTAYKRIYFGKPKYARMEKVADEYYQYYICSKEQVFLYFRKFDPSIVEIVAPESLRKRMEQFYRSGVDTYSANKELKNGGKDAPAIPLVWNSSK